MAAAVYETRAGTVEWFLEVTAGDKPTTGLNAGSRYSDLSGLEWVFNGTEWSPLILTIRDKDHPERAMAINADGSINSGVSLDPGDIVIGAVQLSDGLLDTRATVKAGTALVEGDNALATRDPKAITDLDAIAAVAGTTAGAAVVTDAGGTIQQFLRGLVKLFAARLGLGVNNLASGTVTVDTTAGGTEIVAARALRKYVTIMNLSNTVVYIGTGTVTSSFFPILGVVGAAITLETTTAVKGLSASGSVSLAVIEGYWS